VVSADFGTLEESATVAGLRGKTSNGLARWPITLPVAETWIKTQFTN